MDFGTEQKILGPAWTEAFNEQGMPTPAAEAFVKEHGCEIRDLKRYVDEDGNELVCLRRIVGNDGTPPPAKRLPMAGGKLSELTRKLAALGPKKEEQPIESFDLQLSKSPSFVELQQAVMILLEKLT